jgi:hypothetical protein
MHMTLLEYARKVYATRALQCEYFRLGTPNRLQAAKKAEHELDLITKRIMNNAEAETPPPRTGPEMVAWLTSRPDARIACRRAFAIGRSWRLPPNIADWSQEAVTSVYNEMILKPVGPFVGGAR